VQGNYKGEPIESIVPTADRQGVMLQTTGNHVYFLDRQQALQQLNITVTDSGFVAPPGAQLLIEDKTVAVPAKGAYVKTAPNVDFPGYQYQIDTTDAVEKQIPGIGWLKWDSNGVPSDNYSNYIPLRVIIDKDGKVVDESSLQIKLDDRLKLSPLQIRTKEDKLLERALLVVDGKQTATNKISDLDVKNIERIDVLKGAAATVKYGNQGEYGVIEITTKHPSSTINLQASILPDNALYLINGKESTKEQVQQIDPNKITSTKVLKGDDALKAYGDKGKNGVISIETTDKTPSWWNENTLNIKDGKEVTLKESAEAFKKGLVTSYGEMSPTAAMKTYGEKGKNGATIITTKGATNEVTFSDKATSNGLEEKTVVGYPKPRSADGNNTAVTQKDRKEITVEGHPLPNPVTNQNSTTQKNPEPIKVMGYPILKGKTAASIKPDEVVVIGYSNDKSDAVFSKVEEPATFPGGVDGWRRYLERNLQYPEAAQKNNTQGTVRVQLTVDESGNIIDLKALNDPGNGLAEEALRVLKKGPKWIPARQNGKAVTYQFVQSISFKLL
jgi:TonB family protein